MRQHASPRVLARSLHGPPGSFDEVHDQAWGWPRIRQPTQRARCHKTMTGGGHVGGCQSRCNGYTPCLLKLNSSRPEDHGVTSLPLAAYGAVLANGSAGFARALTAGLRPTIHRRLLPLYTSGELALRITGPLSDGFWVRVTIALVQAEWAQAAGLPVSIRYRSAQDNYDDTSVDEDGWQQYFEPVNAVWDPRHTVMLPCIGARMAFEQRHGPYAWQWRPLLQRRTLHAAATAVVPLRPKEFLLAAAADFWHAHGVGTRDDVLGVHMRGTDRKCAVSVSGYVPLLRAYLCHRPSASVFVATDDVRMLAELRASLANVSARLLWRDALRSSGKLNAGVHAHRLGGAHRAAQLGADAVLDTLLLSQSSFLLGTVSAVTEYAVLLSPHKRLLHASFILDVASHPLPAWRHACERLKPPPRP